MYTYSTRFIYCYIITTTCWIFCHIFFYLCNFQFKRNNYFLWCILGYTGFGLAVWLLLFAAILLIQFPEKCPETFAGLLRSVCRWSLFQVTVWLDFSCLNERLLKDKFVLKKWCYHRNVGNMERKKINVKIPSHCCRVTVW